MKLRALHALPVLAGLLLAGCGQGSSSSGAGAAAGGSGAKAAPDLSSGPNQLVVISPNSTQIEYEFEHLFTAKYPQASIKWVDTGGSSDDLAFVLSQFHDRPAGVGIDVFFGGGIDSFMDLDRAKLLAPLHSTYGIPAQLHGVTLRAADTTWVGSVLSGFGILYNKAIVTRDHLPVPASWAGLGNPLLRNRVIAADPRQSGSAHMIYELILQSEGWAKGWQTLTAIAGNARQFSSASSAVPNDIASGNSVMGPCIDFYAFDKIKSAGAGKLAYVVPRGETVVTPDPIGVLKGAPHAQLAKEFVDLVMSPAGQKLWMYAKGTPGGPINSDLYRMAILPTLYKPISPYSLMKINPYSGAAGFKFDPAKSAERLRALNDLIGAVLIDDQDALKAQWQTTPDAAKLTYVPVSEAQLTLDAKKWGDPVFRNATIANWNKAMARHFK